MLLFVNVLIERECHSCKKIKPITEFHKDKKLPLGYAYRCKECAKKRLHEWYIKNRQKCIDYSKQYTKTHSEEHKKTNRRWWRNHPEQTAKYRKIYNEKVHLEVLTHYGGNPPECACCAESHIDFLTIDHINGGGTKQRAQIKRYGSSFFVWLIKNNFPEGYRVLCYNCNCSKKGNRGFCPVHHPEQYTDEARFLPC